MHTKIWKPLNLNYTLRDKLKDVGKLSTYFDIKDNFHMENTHISKNFNIDKPFANLELVHIIYV
jgi:hypothetical protein